MPLKLITTDLRDWLWKYPAEIVEKVDGVALIANIDLTRAIGRPLPPGEPGLRALGDLVHAAFLRAQAGPEPPEGIFARLPTEQREYLAFLLKRVGARALKMRRQRPDIPVALPPDQLGWWSNFLSCSWFDPQDHPEVKFNLRVRS